jgi:DNA-binding CsgD family transcriptional regulator/tetratricopeptide (TPR) repeat protein
VLPVTESATTELLQRDRDLAALDARLCDAAEGRGGVAVVTGPLGIGKTALLRALGGRANGRGMTVLQARGSPLERDFAYGVVRRLFEPLGLERGAPAEPALVTGAAALALRAFATGSAPVPSPEDAAFATVHGLYWLTANLAGRAPLLLAVDDAHWADAPSLRFLAYLGARLDGLPALLLVALRGGEPGPADDLLTELEAISSTDPVRPQPLDLDAATALVRGGIPTASAEFCRACHSATGGNPLLLLTLMNSLRDHAGPSTGTTAETVAAFGAPNVARLLDRQLAHLPAGASELATAVAVLGAEAPLRLVADLADLDVETVIGVADALRLAGILATGPLPWAPLAGTALDFAHPVLRAAVADGMTPPERDRAHRRAAALLDRDGASAERRAVHLLHTVPRGESHAVDTLRIAADVASQRGAPDTAAVYLRRALDEPPTADQRSMLRLQLGLLTLAADRDPSAPEILREAVTGIEPPHRLPAATLAARGLGVAGYFEEAAALAWVLDPVEATAMSEPARLLDAEVIANGWLVASKVPHSLRRVARYAAAEPPDDRAGRMLLVSLAHQMLIAAQPAGPAIALLRRALGAGELLEEVSLVNVFLAMDLAAADEFELAERVCTTAIEHGQRCGSRSLVATFAFPRGLVALRRGALAEAEADARWSLELKLAMGPAHALGWPLSVLVETLVARGDLVGAEQALAAVPLVSAPPQTMAWALVKQAIGRLRLAQGRPRDAADELLEAGRRWDGLACRTPSLATWRGDAARALHLLGEHARARELADEQLALARPTGLPRVVGNALRDVAAVTPAERSALLDDAVQLLSESPGQLDLAHALIDLGAALRRAGRRVEARVPLRKGLDLAHRAGADPLARTGHTELVAAGARPRRPTVTGLDALTVSERRTAVLAAEGMTNREIAERLFVTQRTVETHLQHAFGKLGIHRREDLQSVLTPSPRPP